MISFTKNKNKSNTPNLVPLINVVFLLLIFFMLAGTLKRTDIFDVNPPYSITGADAEAPELTILISENNNIALNNTKMDLSSLKQNLLNNIKLEKIAEVLIKADGQALSGTLSKVINIVRSTGIDRVAIVTKSQEFSK